MDSQWYCGPVTLRTEKQRKELCRDCPIAKVADIVGDPCSLLILRDLIEGPHRFGHLDESLGMSTRTLTNTLRRLEKSDFIRRIQRRTLPPHVEYQITPKGRAFSTVLEAMRAYGKKYL